MEKTLTFNVLRYRPDKSPKPFYQDYSVPYRDDMVVLDGLNYIKDHLDGSLTFRWSCRMGVCGSCGAMINGVPKLTCETFLKDFDSQIIRVEPLRHFPIIKDLVIGLEDFITKLKSVRPWVIRGDHRPVSAGEYLQKPEQLDLFKQASMCINCMLCYAACPVYGLDRDFIGPAASALAYRYIMDSRDEGKKFRLPDLLGKRGVWDCTFVGECTAVCPKEVDPALAIQRLKVQGAIETIRSLTSKILRR